MKKFLSLGIFLFLIWQVDCQAEVFYSDYHLIKENTGEYIAESDILRREEIKYYNNFFYERVNEGYYQIGNNPASAPVVDKKDYTYQKEYIYKYNSDCTGPYTAFLVGSGAKTRYLELKNFSVMPVSLTAIEIFYQNQKIDYEIHSTNYQMGDMVEYSTIIVLDLKQEYILTDLQMEISMASTVKSELIFTMYSYLNYQALYEYIFLNFIIRSGPSEVSVVNFLNKAEFIALASSLPFVNQDYLDSITYVNYFIYHNYEYKFYDLKKVKLDNYTAQPLAGYYHDEDDSQTLYTYYKRDKVEVADEITNLSDKLIIASSLPITDIKIDSDLNLFKNGLYTASFTVDDNFSFQKQIVVNIPKQKELKTISKNSNPVSIITPEEAITSEEPVLVKANYDEVVPQKQSKIGGYLAILGLFIILLLIVFKPKKKN